MKGGRSKAQSSNADARLAVKRKTKKEKKAAKDPNKPKRPASAFLVFMEGFRTEFKEKNPGNNSVAAVGKAGGDRWRSMDDADKAPYVTIAEERKKEYEKKMQTYERKKAGYNDEEESDKSKSEINDDEHVVGSDEEDDD